MELTFIPGILLGMLLLGVATLARGARRLQLSAQVLALVFALTTVSWIGLLVVLITLTLRPFLPVA